MAAEILTKRRPKWLKLEEKMCTGYIMAVGKVSPGRGIWATIIFTQLDYSEASINLLIR